VLLQLPPRPNVGVEWVEDFDLEGVDEVARAEDELADVSRTDTSFGAIRI
jgi:hypothetical protein